MRFSKGVGLRTQHERAEVSGFGIKQANTAHNFGKIVEKQANLWYNHQNTSANVKAYIRDKPAIDILLSHNANIIQRAEKDGFIVNAGKPQITDLSHHAIDNLNSKPDRAEMTKEVAQAFVDNAKLALYQPANNSLRFMCDIGYAVLNWDNELITAVPQKWRKKYDKYLE